MKRYISFLLAVVLLLMCLPATIPKAEAAEKNETREISIVFDNSGSMYEKGKQAWCRAIYATEVFASMLNKGDVLQIYPMSPFTIGSKEYSMDKPLKITDPAQASQIRDIYTLGEGITNIESLDRAIEGLEKSTADKKYLVVLSDGTNFYRNGQNLGPEQSKRQLERYFSRASKDMIMMYLGIDDDGVAAIDPDVQSEYFIKTRAEESEEVLSALTEMCNLIFGRDILPDSRQQGKTLNFEDVSMKRLIVFIQGKNISNVKLTGPDGEVASVSKQQTKYSTQACGAYPDAKYDTSLQGMIVTFADCTAGKYTLSYSGSEDSVEVYYEPDVDLDFVFTDAAGNQVNPEELYEGEYKVSYGMLDAKTGKLVNSELLGNPSYTGSYIHNGETTEFSANGFVGEETVTLMKGDTFDANLTVTYLSGYTISKDSTDFGWPFGGITIKPRPAGMLELKIAGGEEEFSLQHLEEGTPYEVTVFYDGVQVTDLEGVNLMWDEASSNALIKKEIVGDHFELKLYYKDANAPQNTQCGACSVPLMVTYTAQGSAEAQGQGTLTYKIKDDFSPLKMELLVTQDYIVISELEQSQEIVVQLTLNGAKLTPEQFANVKDPVVDCGGIQYQVTRDDANSSFRIKLLPTEGIADARYPITVSTEYTDLVGRPAPASAETAVTLSTLPLWMIWMFVILGLLILFIIIWVILHIKVYPKKLHTTKRTSTMFYDGEEIPSAHFNVDAALKKGNVRVQSKYGGRTVGVSMDVTKGKESYLCKSQAKRYADVKVASVKKFGPAKIQEVMIGSVKYELDDNGKLLPAMANQKPFPLKHGMQVKYSGVISDGGVDKDFEVTSQLNFKKKK